MGVDLRTSCVSRSTLVSDSQRVADVGLEGVRVEVEVGPGDSHRPPTVRDKDSIASPVFVESVVSAVRVTPVELHDELRFVPDAVHLQTSPAHFEADIGLRLRQPTASAEVKEAIFELAACPARREHVTLDDSRQWPASRSARIAAEDRIKSGVVRQSKELGLLYEPAQLLRVEFRGKVEQGPSDARHRHPVDDGAVLRWKHRTVNRYSGPGSSMLLRGYMDRTARGGAQLPKRRSREMARRGPGCPSTAY